MGNSTTTVHLIFEVPISAQYPHNTHRATQDRPGRACMGARGINRGDRATQARPAVHAWVHEGLTGVTGGSCEGLTRAKPEAWGSTYCAVTVCCDCAVTVL